MSSSQIFSIINILALPMWMLMLFVPNWKVSRWLIKYKVIPIFFAILYVFYIIQTISQGYAMDFSSLEAIMKLFTVENAVLAGWLHYLAFDLLIGMWILEENQKLGIHQLLIAPCLVGTFMLGPVGFLLFLILKTIKKS